MFFAQGWQIGWSSGALGNDEGAVGKERIRKGGSANTGLAARLFE